jgi:SPP1 gp7 family putative phage head morphogenesis protein
MSLCAHTHLHDARARRFDPSNTAGLRRKFEADLMRRFRALRGLVYQSIVKNDVFGLGKFGVQDGIVFIMRDQEALPAAKFAFARSKDKIDGFMAWLIEQEEKGILSITPGTSNSQASENAWTNTYVQSAYHQGVADAGNKMRRAGADVAPSWIQNAFTRPIHADRLGIAYTRTFNQLKGITDTMDQQISNVLTNGLSRGAGPMQIARDINQRIEGIGAVRARVLARTEVINAHAQATLNSYQEAGIHGVDVEAEFTTSGENVCLECEDLEGKTYTIQEAQGIIPVHPNCRCAWNPKVINGSEIQLI